MEQRRKGTSNLFQRTIHRASAFKKAMGDGYQNMGPYREEGNTTLTCHETVNGSECQMSFGEPYFKYLDNYYCGECVYQKFKES